LYTAIITVLSYIYNIIYNIEKYSQRDTAIVKAPAETEDAVSREAVLTETGS